MAASSTSSPGSSALPAASATLPRPLLTQMPPPTPEGVLLLRSSPRRARCSAAGLLSPALPRCSRWPRRRPSAPSSRRYSSSPHTAFLAATLPRNRSSSRPIPSAAICATISSPRPSSPPLPSSPPPVGCCSSFSPFPFPRRRCFLAAIAFLVAAVPVRCPVPAASFVRRHRLPRDPRYLHRRSHTTVPRRRLCPSSSLPLPRFRPRSLPLCDAPAPRSVGPLPDFGLRSSLEGLPRTRFPYLYVDA